MRKEEEVEEVEVVCSGRSIVFLSCLLILRLSSLLHQLHNRSFKMHAPDTLAARRRRAEVDSVLFEVFL